MTLGMAIAKKKKPGVGELKLRDELAQRQQEANKRESDVWGYDRFQRLMQPDPDIAADAEVAERERKAYGFKDKMDIPKYKKMSKIGKIKRAP